jgi:two-component system, sensor histidine kinase RegB
MTRPISKLRIPGWSRNGKTVRPGSTRLQEPGQLPRTLVVLRWAAIVSLLPALGVMALVLHARPLPPWPSGNPWLGTFGLWATVIAAIGCNAAHAWLALQQASRMELALAASRTLLEREQRLAALDGLAAATAHQLGTPLATIQVVTRELLRAHPDPSPLHGDLQLLAEQSQRCRDILMRLARSPDTGNALQARLSVADLLEDVAGPHRSDRVTVLCRSEGAPELAVRRRPEILHGLSLLVENAVDFARSKVSLVAIHDAAKLTIEVRDDGPGIAAGILPRLGEPHVTSRGTDGSSREGSVRQTRTGLGLGFFIAKTLLERTGASVEVASTGPAGTMVTATWNRRLIEADPVAEPGDPTA